MADERISFEEWVRYLFDREVMDPRWYISESEIPDFGGETFLEYGRRLFLNSGTLLLPYSDAQVDAGLWRLIDPGGGDEVFALRDRALPLASKLEFLSAIYDLNRDCFAPRCTPHLSHLDRAGAPEITGRMNMICYMWWDVFPLLGNDGEDMKPLLRASVETMEKCLSLKNTAVIEAALHGLGHYADDCPDEVKRVIGRFLPETQDLSPELRRYAEAAAEGGVL